MSVPVSEIRQRLDGLSASDENYRKYLLELLNHQDLKPYIYSLQRSDLRGLVELLDEVNKNNIHIRWYSLYRLGA